MVLSIFKTLVVMFPSLGDDAIGSLLLYLLVVLSPAGIAQGWGVHLRYFTGGESLKAQGSISSWVPELDPKSLGDPNAGEPFLQVLSIIGRHRPYAKKYFHLASIFKRSKRHFSEFRNRNII